MTVSIGKHAVTPARSDAPWRVQPAYVISFLLFLVANMFSGHTAQLHVPVGPDRVLFGLCLLLLVLDRRTPWHRLRLGVVHVVALCTVLWAGASGGLVGTVLDPLGFFALLDRLLVPYVIFALAPVIFSDRSSRRLLLKVLTIVGIYLGLTAIFEILGPQAFVFPRYIAQQHVGISFGRARGPFLSSDDDGAALAAIFFAAAANAAISSTRLWKALSVLSCVLCLVGTLLTLTRAVWIGVSVGIIVTALLHQKTRRALPVVALVIAVALGGALASSSSLRAKVTDRATTSRSVYDRQNTNAAALRALEQHPLTGVGWLEFLSVSDRYVRQARTYPLTKTNIEIHNVVLSRLAELGLIGGGLWILSVLLGPISVAWRGRRTIDREDRWIWIAFVGVLVDWLVQIQFSPFPYPLPNNLVWLFAGVVLGMSMPEGLPRRLRAVSAADRAAGANEAAGVGEAAGARFAARRGQPGPSDR